MIRTLSEIIKYLIHITERYHPRIGNYECPCYIGHLLEILYRIILKIDLIRYLDPLQNNSPLGNSLLIYKVHRRYVAADAVSAVASAA